MRNFNSLISSVSSITEFHIKRLSNGLHYCDDEDIRQICLIKLYSCMELYDTNKSGATLATYYNKALWKSLGEEAYRFRSPYKSRKAPYTREVLDATEAHTIYTPEQALIDKEAIAAIKSYKHADLIYDRIISGYGWQDLGNKYGMSRQGANQAYDRAIRRMRVDWVW